MSDEQAAFDRLHPAVQHHIVNSLGWSGLRPTQQAAVAPILDGEHCILLAPTAGGKTEAAIFPVLSQILTEDWRGLSVLYVCPIRALLNNLEPRLSHYFGLVGRRVGVWHGDISDSVKKKALREPPDLLLTTPESLEGMLISAKDEKREFLLDVRLIIVDEMHAFCGDDRGWHVRCLIRRLAQLIDRRIQVLGLTATVGNPKELIDWLAPGQPTNVVGVGHSGTEADLVIDYVGSLENAAKVVASLHGGEKRLVFCDSRAKTEELAACLRELGVRTYLSHSSLSSDERRQAEKAFAEEPNCVIVATSTLELGIDVGDLDRVIQIDSPSSVASFLQRMGRTGRRAGTARNCLFLATSEEGLMIACAIVRMWREGYVEPITPPEDPWHLVAQQAMALVLQKRGLTRPDLDFALRELFRELNVSTTSRVIDWMLRQNVLWQDEGPGGLIGLGDVGEKEFGRRHFESIISTFSSPLLLKVMHGQRELGSIDPMSLQPREGKAPAIVLGGRYWQLVASDWKSRVAYVEPTEARGKASWLGTSRSLEYALCQTMQRVLCDGEVPATLSSRAKVRLGLLSESFEMLTPGQTIAVKCIRDGKTEWRWWTFAGGRANFVLAEQCGTIGAKAKSYDNFSLRLSDLPNFAVPFECPLDQVTDDGAKKLAQMTGELKFGTCLPEELAIEVIRKRISDPQGVQRVLAHPVAIGVQGDGIA